MIILSRAKYPEPVVRKALYWLSEKCGTILQEEEQCWCITLQREECVFELHRLLNDFLLREELDAATKGVRLDIIRAALKRLASTSNEP